MIKIIKKIIIKEQFQPSMLGIFLNPFYIIRNSLYVGIKEEVKFIRGKLLDFGCGSKPYSNLFNVTEYVGVDIESSGHSHENEKIDIYYDGKKIPIEDEYFDSVFSSEVFEHIFNLPEILLEIHRVLKKDGILLCTIPFVWDEHEKPYDNARYTSFGVKYLMENAGFEVIKIKKNTTYIETLFQMLSAYVWQVILPKNGYMKLIGTVILVAPINILGLVLSAILPKNNDFYHNNIVVAKKKKNIN